jgi:hypothetical protein
MAKILVRLSFLIQFSKQELRKERNFRGYHSRKAFLLVSDIVSAGVAVCVKKVNISFNS